MVDSMDDVVQKMIRERFGEQVAACSSLLELAFAELSAWSGRPIKRGADRIILAEAARATKTFDAVIRLCRAGFGEQAVMLGRSLFEGMAIAHWVKANRREAVRLFTRHERFSALLWYETLEILGWVDETDRARHRRLRIYPKARKELVGLFGQYGTKAWLRRSVPQVLRDIQDQWDTKGRHDLWAFHDIAYRLSNQILHSTAASTAATTTQRTRTQLHMTAGASIQFVSQALYSAYWTYGQLFTLLGDVFKLSTDEAFRDLYHSGGRAFTDGNAVEV